MKQLSEHDIAEILRPLSPFYYWPNIGNLGDLLIAEGTRQFFDRYGLHFREFRSGETAIPEGGRVALVFAGGARFTANWCSAEAVDIMLSPIVETSVVLPHSINGVDGLMAGLGPNCHLICREQPSYDYCSSVQTKAKLYLANDMAIALDLKALDCQSLDVPPEQLNGEERRTQRLLKGGLPERMKASVVSASVRSMIRGEKKRVAFLLRNDSERGVPYRSPFTYDISVAWDTSGRKMRYNGNMLLAFADAVRQVDAVVTDRLHVAIMCWKAGVEVYMLDNSYHKLSGVYRKSLSNEPSVHLLATGRFTPELERAWKRLNSPARLLRLRAETARRRVVGKLKNAAKRLLRH